MFRAKKSYFRRIFDLRHFYGPDDNLYHPARESRLKRKETPNPGWDEKTAPNGTVPAFRMCHKLILGWEALN